jgi:hypothetical protein
LLGSVLGCGGPRPPRTGENVFGKLIELILAAKSGAVSGVLILAGAVVTVSGGNGVTTVTIEHPSPTPAIEAPADPAPSPLRDEETRSPQNKDREKKEHASAPPTASCADEAKARAEALQKVHDGFTRFHTQIEQLRSERRSERALETIKKADELIKEISEKAERVLHEMGRCDDKDGGDGEDEDTTEEDDEADVTTASFDEADAVTMQRVAERAVAAMETVYNLAKSAAEATPSPKPTPKQKATEKPRSPENAKPTRTPSCDDKIYAAKKVLAAAFERFHSQNDLLWKLAEKLDDEKVFAVVKASDKTMHTTYDSTKEAILKAGCAENVGMQLAMKAADTFERAFISARAAFGTTTGSHP